MTNDNQIDSREPNPSVDDCIEIVESYGPYGFDVNEDFRIKIALKDEVLRLRAAIDGAVSRFLMWKLPKDFHPDCGITFKREGDYEHPEYGRHIYEPVGTNLLSAEQAKAMFEYCLQAPVSGAALAHAAKAEPVRLMAIAPEGFDAGDDIYIMPDDVAKKSEYEKRGFVFKPLFTTPQPQACSVPDGIADIAAERKRQQEKEGWTIAHDDEHIEGHLALAGACYALPPGEIGYIESVWPWDFSWFKPKSRRQDLVRAAALIVAEIERIDRAASPTQTDSGDKV